MNETIHAPTEATPTGLLGIGYPAIPREFDPMVRIVECVSRTILRCA